MAGNSLLRAAEVADLLAISIKTAYRWADEGALPAVKLSDRCVRFDPAAIEEWIASKAARS